MIALGAFCVLMSIVMVRFSWKWRNETTIGYQRITYEISTVVFIVLTLVHSIFLVANLT